MAVMNFVMLPMCFLSGAIFPPKRLPGWLSLLTKVDPVTYVVALLLAITQFERTG